MKGARIVLLLAFGLTLAVLAWTALDQPLARGPVSAPMAQLAEAMVGTRPQPLPLPAWSEFFRESVAEGRWRELREQLLVLRDESPETFAGARLGYMLGRVALESGELELARKELAAFLDGEEPFRRLARFHETRLAAAQDPPQASRLRQAFLVDYPDAEQAAEVLEVELSWLEEHATPEAVFDFVEAVRDVLGERVRRDLEARLVEIFVAQEDLEAASVTGNRVLERGIGDDAAERAARALDHPGLLPLLSADQLARLGEAHRTHRHFGRAIELLTAARARLPERRAELDFAIGRAHFFAEEYEAAIEAYLRGAALATTRAQRARFLFHASRAAQLLGDDVRGLDLLTRAIAVPGSHPATAAALGNRLRTRLHHGDPEGAARDLELLRRYFPRDEALLAGSVAYAAGLVAADQAAAAAATLERIPQSLLGRWAPSEIAYWRAKALEEEAPPLAVRTYLGVLRAEVPTHFAHFARQRLREPALANVSAELAAEGRERAAERFRAGDLEEARKLATDAWLLAAGTGAGELDFLAEIYRALPGYREILELQPIPFPTFPLPPGADAADQLMAMGLFDDAEPAIAGRYPLTPASSGLARAEAYRLAFATRSSIAAAEVLMQQVPDDFVPALLPRRVQELLFPRYFLAEIEKSAARHGANARLMLAIMREESRFEPRAKSPAAARGLMQFVISTARQVGAELGLDEVEAEDLYRPPVIIELGARYVGSLLEELDGDPYAVAAAYNAGPYQARLWRRLQPAPGHDHFLTTVHFEETRHYVRKVLNSYYRYGEI